MFFLMLETLENESDREKIEALYRKYSGFVKCLIIKKFDILSKEADDIVNEVFVRVIKYRNRFDSQNERECMRLLVVYTRSVCITVCNKKNLEYQANGEYYYIENGETAEEQSKKIFGDNSDGSAADKAVKLLDSLPSRTRETIRLKYYYGCSTKEIADLLGMSESNVCVTLNRALNKLKKELEGDYD